MRRLAFFAVVLLSGCVPEPQPDGTRRDSWILGTEKHQGHLYVVHGSSGHFLHSPACPCRGRLRPVEQTNGEEGEP